MSASALVTIAAALNCSITDLFAGTEGIGDPAPLPSLSSEAIRMARDFDRLASNQRGAIVRLVASLAPDDPAAKIAA
jgi:hypothetical protein